MTHQELRKLPSVDRLLQESTVVAARAEYGHDLTLQAARDVLDETRQAILEAGQRAPTCRRWRSPCWPVSKR